MNKIGNVWFQVTRRTFGHQTQLERCQLMLKIWFEEGKDARLDDLSNIMGVLIMIAASDCASNPTVPYWRTFWMRHFTLRNQCFQKCFSWNSRYAQWKIPICSHSAMRKIKITFEMLAWLALPYGRLKKWTISNDFHKWNWFSLHIEQFLDTVNTNISFTFSISVTHNYE